MNSLATPRFVLRRLRKSWALLSCVFLGMLFATTLAAAIPVYLVSLERLALNLEIDRLGRFQSKLLAYAFHVPVNRESFASTESELQLVAEETLGDIYVDSRRFVTGLELYAGTPSYPLPGPAPRGGAWRAKLRSLPGFERHAAIVDGRLPNPSGPLEAAIGAQAADELRVRVGDQLRLTADIESGREIVVPVVGIIEPADPDADFWLPTPLLFFNTEGVDPEDEGDGVYDPLVPPIPLFTHLEPLADTIAEAFPGTLSISIWTLDLDASAMKRLSPDEFRKRFLDFELQAGLRMPGAIDASSGVLRMLARFDARIFYARVPLALLQTILVGALLFFLLMMVAYLVRSREEDAALLRARGAGGMSLAKAYAVEGGVMVVLALLLAPVLAVVGVALAGKLPFFHGMTGGALLPLSLGPRPVIAAAAAAFLCLLVYIAPAAVGTRGGLLLRKLRSSRPPTTMFIHRRFIDVGLLVLGGLIYWELYNRGNILTGGLFRDVEINEALSLAPALFLLAIALLFLRAFPLFARFVSGESPALAHVALGLSVVPLAVGIAFREARVEGAIVGEWMQPLLILALATAAYVFTARSRMARYWIAGVAAQAALAAWFLSVEPLRYAEHLAAPTVLLLATPPLQLAFALFRKGSKIAPAPASIVLKRLSRNPLQYAWLMLLLVIVTGAGALATTVGGTLERGRVDSARYDAGADIRIALSDDPLFNRGSFETIKGRYESIPGVDAVTFGFREPRHRRSDNVEFFALDSREFPHVAWFRDDFSEGPIGDIMRALHSYPPPEPIALPDDGVAIGVWTKLQQPIDQLWAQVVLEEADGGLVTLSLGELSDPAPPSEPSADGSAAIPEEPAAPEWKLLTREIPARLQRPLNLVSVQLYEARVGNLTPGVALIDDIFVIRQGSGERVLVEGFEGLFRWSPIIASGLAPDRLYTYVRDAKEGTRSAMLRFGQEGQRGVRGIYVSPTRGELPVVVSEGFRKSVGLELGDRILVGVGGRAIPAVARGFVEHFPTMRPGQRGFILADLDATLAHANIISPAFPLTVNEVFLSVSPVAHDIALEGVNAVTSGIVYDRLSRTEGARLDPLTTAGWTSLTLVALVIILVAAGIGYATYALTSLRQSGGEMGFLRSMGLSGRQLFALLAFERLAIFVIGVGLGTWAGFQMSDLAVSSVVIVDPDETLPPYAVVTDWWFMLPVYLGLASIAIGEFAAMRWFSKRVELQTIARVEGP